MLRLSKFALLSVFLLGSADAGLFSGKGGNLFSSGKEKQHSYSNKKYDKKKLLRKEGESEVANLERFKMTAPDSYCYCPAKHGTVGVVHFPFDSSQVLDPARKLIDEEIAKCIASRLAEDSEIKVLVTGHADKRGTQEYNLALGSRRASAAKDYLISSVKQIESDIPEDRFCTNSKGKEELVAHDETEEAHAQNRRAVIEFTEDCN